MTMNLGLKRSLTTCKDYPALLLMPTFSLWAFGSREKKSYKNCKGSSNFGVSFTSTFINTLITCSGMIVSSIYSYLNISIALKKSGYFWILIPLTIGNIIISAILVVIISCMNNCMCCSCACCCEPCLPMTEASTIFKQEQKEIFDVQVTMTENLNTNEIV